MSTMPPSIGGMNYIGAYLAANMPLAADNPLSFSYLDNGTGVAPFGTLQWSDGVQWWPIAVGGQGAAGASSGSLQLAINSLSTQITAAQTTAQSRPTHTGIDPPNPNPQSGNWTLQLTDFYEQSRLDITSPTQQFLFLPPTPPAAGGVALPTNAMAPVYQGGAGCISVIAPAGASVVPANAQTCFAGQKMWVSVRGPNNWEIGFSAPPPNGQPYPTGVPTVTGSSSQGSTLTVVDATFSGSPTPVISRQWFQTAPAAGSTPVAIGGATALTFVTTSVPIGYAVTAVSYGTSTGFAAATSYPSIPVTITNASINVPQFTTPPSVSGTGAANSNIIISAGVATGSPTSYTFQPTLNGAAFGSSTTQAGTTLTVPVLSTMAGGTFSATVIATNGNGSSPVTTASNSIAILGAVPTISGSSAAALIDQTTVGAFVAGDVVGVDFGGTANANSTVTIAFFSYTASGAVMTTLQSRSSTITYTLQSTDVGTLVGAVGYVQNSNTTTIVNIPAHLISAATGQPVFATSPSITPTTSPVAVGAVLNVVPGTGTNFASSTYAWYSEPASGSAVQAGIGASYTTQVSDGNNTVYAIQTAINGTLTATAHTTNSIAVNAAPGALSYAQSTFNNPNLTSVGAVGWGTWPTSTTLVTNQASPSVTYTGLGTNPCTSAYSSYNYSMTWSNGIGTTSGTHSYGLYTAWNPAPGSGIQFQYTVGAAAVPFDIYFDSYNQHVQFVASVSDGSFATQTWVVPGLANGNLNSQVMRIVANAGSAGKTVTVQMTSLQTYNGVNLGAGYINCVAYALE